MPRFKLTIAYDGTDFCGWQRQLPPADMDVPPSKVIHPSDAASAPAQGAGEGVPRITLRTVQEVVQRAVQDAVREPVELLGASRTDAGVHARGQVAAFTCGGEARPRDGETARQGRAQGSQPRADESAFSSPAPVLSPATERPTSAFTPHPPTGWPVDRGTEPLRRAINSRLPADVLVSAVQIVPDRFNPIGDCVAKGYSYSLHVSPDRPVFERRFVHQVWTPLDLSAMNEAAARIAGEHDFAAFAKAGHGRESTVRTVFACHVEQERAEAPPDQSRRLRIEISGNGFLYNMVRIIAGTLVEVGRGRLTPDDVSAAIQRGDRRLAGPTLPPTGLCLEWVRYR